VIDIVHVEFHPLVKWSGASAVDLPEAGDARADAEAAALPVLIKSFVIPDWKGPGAYQAHVAFQDIKELWELINAGFSQEFSEASEARIVLDLEYRPAHLVEVCNLGEPLFGALNHGSKLEEAKSPFVKAHPLLDEKDWSWRGELDQEGSNKEQRRESDNQE